MYTKYIKNEIAQFQTKLINILTSCQSVLSK